MQKGKVKKQQTLEQLEMRGDFVRRHIGCTRKQINEILEYLGLESLEDASLRART